MDTVKSTRPASHWPLAWLAGFAAAVLGACGAQADGQALEVDLQIAEAPLAAGQSLSLWPGGAVTVCWANTGFPDEKNRIRDAITRGWDTYSALSFTWPANANDLCPHIGEEVVGGTLMPIYVRSSTDFGGQCSGRGGRYSATECGGTMQCQCIINTASGSPPERRAVEYAALHEVGHGLGFVIHEHQRPDRPANIQSTCTDPNTDPNKWTANGNYTITGDARLLTVYDGGSIMNYCYDPDGDGVHGTQSVEIGGALPELSARDKLGMEILYPFNLTRRPVALGGVSDAGGTAYLVRSDIPTALQTDWSSRGAHFSAFPTIQWRDGVTWQQFSSAIAPSLVISGVKSVQVSATDSLGRSHAWTGVSLKGDNAAFTSVVSTAANYLLL